MKTADPQTLPLVCEYTPKTGSYFVHFPDAAKVEYWSTLTPPDRAANVSFLHGSADDRVQVLHPSPADFLASLESLPESQKADALHAFAGAVSAEMTSIEVDRRNGKISKKEAIERAENFIERLGGPDITKVPLSVAAQSAVLGEFVGMYDHIATHVASLTPTNANALEDPIARAQADLARPPTQAELATVFGDVGTDKDRGNDFPEPPTAEEIAADAQKAAHLDSVDRAADELATSSALLQREESGIFKATMDRLDALRVEYADASQVQNPTRPASSQADEVAQASILTEARDLTSSFSGPDLTRIPLSVGAQDYVQGKISRADLENLVLDNDRAAKLAPPSQGHSQGEERSIADDR